MTLEPNRSSVPHWRRQRKLADLDRRPHTAWCNEYRCHPKCPSRPRPLLREEAGAVEWLRDFLKTARFHESYQGERSEALAALATLEARLVVLEEAAELALAGIPDHQHPYVHREHEGRLVAAQIILADALGDEDPGNVEMARATLAALSRSQAQEADRG